MSRRRWARYCTKASSIGGSSSLRIGIFQAAETSIAEPLAYKKDKGLDCIYS
jgi:hypothetical protein